MKDEQVVKLQAELTTVKAALRQLARRMQGQSPPDYVGVAEFIRLLADRPDPTTAT